MSHVLQVELWFDASDLNRPKFEADELVKVFGPLFTDNHTEFLLESGLYGEDGELFIMQIEASDEGYALFLKKRKTIIDIYGSQFDWDKYGVVRIEIEDYAEMQRQAQKAFEDMSWD